MRDSESHPRIVLLGSTSAYMYNNLLHGFYSCKDTLLSYKKITREYRLDRDFNFIMDYEASQGVLRCTRTNTFINKFSNLSANVQYSDVPEFVLGFYLVHDHV